MSIYEIFYVYATFGVFIAFSSLLVVMWVLDRVKPAVARKPARQTQARPASGLGVPQH